MSSAHARKARPADDASRLESRLLGLVTEIPVVLSPEPPEVFGIAEPPARSSERGIATIPASDLLVCPAFVPPWGGPSDHGLSAMTTSTYTVKNSPNSTGKRN